MAHNDVDAWILARLAQVRSEVDEAFEAGEFAKGCQALYSFVWDEFCDWYLEFAKLWGRSETTSAVLAHVLDIVLRLLHPVMPFVTEVLWQAVTGLEILAAAQWPTHGGIISDPGHAVESMQRLITEIRRFRAEQGLPPGQRVPAALDGLDTAGLASWESDIRSFAKITAPEDGFTPGAAVEAQLTRGLVTVRFDLSGTVDKDAVRNRLVKDLEVQRKELDGTAAKLAAESFLAKAPEQVVAKIRARHEAAKAEIERLEAKLQELGE
jgi:valyl-tRNA synthetase